MFSILPLNLYFAICAQLKKLTLQKYVSHVSVMWPLPGPSRPQDRAGWLDVQCISSQEEKWFFPTCDRYSRSNPAIFLESTIQQIFTLKLASPQSWRQCDEEHSTALPPPLNCSLHVLKRSCYQQIQSPWQQWSPPNHWKYFDNTFEGDLHSPAAGARLTHCTVLAAHFTHSFLILSNNLCQHFSG